MNPFDTESKILILPFLKKLLGFRGFFFFFFFFLTIVILFPFEICKLNSHVTVFYIQYLIPGLIFTISSHTLTTTEM